jgi:hypothetical protein
MGQLKMRKAKEHKNGGDFIEDISGNLELWQKMRVLFKKFVRNLKEIQFLAKNPNLVKKI